MPFPVRPCQVCVERGLVRTGWGETAWIAQTAEARRLPGPGPGVSIMPPVPSSYVEKKKRTM